MIHSWDVPSNTSQAEKLNVVIVDDHEMVALGLQALLDDGDEVSVVASVRTAADALAAVRRYKPDVVLMDYRLPDGTGAEAAKLIAGEDEAPGVVMVTAVADRRVLSQALDAGCCGFVSKQAKRSDLIAAIQAGARHDPFFTPDVLGHLAQIKRFDNVDYDDLSPREVDVLQATANGLSPDQIGQELYLSAHTVKNHLRHAMSKLDSHTKLEAVVKAARARIISIDE